MVQLSQVVLLASIVASCISYSVPKAMPVPEPPVEPSQTDFSDFPTEFMAELIASLTPEEIDELQKPIDLEDDMSDRDGNRDKGPCDKYQDNSNYSVVTATDNEQYYVINHPFKNFQQVNHFVCNDKKGNTGHGNKCGRDNATSVYCCRQGTKIVSMKVYPEPTRNFVRKEGKLVPMGQNSTYKATKKIEKDVLLNSDCFCDEYKSGLSYPGREEVCPLSDSSEYKEQ